MTVLLVVFVGKSDNLVDRLRNVGNAAAVELSDPVTSD